MAPAAATIDSAFRQSAEGRQGLIGASSGLRKVWNEVRMVAPIDTAVLIYGETGTGKELIAKSIHEQSSRASNPFVKVNCAAIPSGLLESELFGHERGSFTGACATTVGRFQRAHAGTLFLDEVGDMPLELQPKLLRVLQEQEFERLGSARTIRVDVRIVAATNQDLEKMVQQGRFRSDLYYRLKVFPIRIPPLRDRREDIPLLIEHFATQSSAVMEKEFATIASDVMESLIRYHWPGNIRELQNCVERAVIASPEPTLQFSFGETRRWGRRDTPSSIRTLADIEREHIEETLRRVGGVLGGPHGAARMLGLPRTTLLDRMRRLGVVREPIRRPRRKETDQGSTKE